MRDSIAVLPHLRMVPSVRGGVKGKYSGRVPFQRLPFHRMRSTEKYTELTPQQEGQQSGGVASEVTEVIELQDQEGVQVRKGWQIKEHGWIFLSFWCTLSVLISYADRTNISTAILEMQKDFDWSDSEKGLVLSIFFVGYALTQLVGGEVSDRVGGKNVLSVGIVAWSVFTFITPLVAKQGWILLLMDRVALGLGEGVAFPAIHSIISSNVPMGYQSTVVGVVTAASYGGTVLAFSLSPWIIGKFGWEVVFYAFGFLAVLWLPPWLFVPVKTRSDAAKDPDAGDPQDGSEMTEAETANLLGEGASMMETGIWPLLKTKPVLAICITQYTQSWGLYVLISWLPTFFEETYGVAVKDIGSYTILPYIAQAVVGVTCGSLADILLSKNWRVKSVRRIFQTVGMLGPAACLGLAVSPFAQDNAEACSIIITAGLGLSAFSLAGVSVSHLDIAPNHAGAVFGAGNTAATAAGFLGVTVTGWLLDETHSWALVFALTGLHYLIGVGVWNAWLGDEPLTQDGLTIKHQTE